MPNYQQITASPFFPSSLSLVRAAALSPKLRVADVEYNTEQIIKSYADARAVGAEILVFPELCITGYTCGDLFLQTALLSAAERAIQKIEDVTASLGGTAVIGVPLKQRDQLYNCAVVISGGRIQACIPKTFLPNYNEFYEMRWFASAYDSHEEVISINGNDIPFGQKFLFSLQYTNSVVPTVLLGVEICEDLWAVRAPSTDMCLAGAHVIANLSASPETLGKGKYRRDLVNSHSARSMCGYVYSSAGVGESTTDLVFSGHNIICENGMVIAEGERYTWDATCTLGDIDIERLQNERLRNSTYRTERPAKRYTVIPLHVEEQRTSILYRTVNPRPFIPHQISEREETCKEIFKMQCTALMKRLIHINCKNVVLGLSGGLDSTLALLVCIAAFDKLGYDRSGIHAISMPGFGTTSRTKTNAQELAEHTGVSFSTIDISAAVRRHFSDIGHDEKLHDLVYENSQARERTQILMDYSQRMGGIVIGTGDLSELALGWCTYNGDHISMYSVNCGVPKTLVRYMVEWCAHEAFTGELQRILTDIVATPVTPELLPLNKDGGLEQQTEDVIGPYALHDFFLHSMMRFQFSPAKIFTLATIGFAGEYDSPVILKWLRVFYRRFFMHQFKRSCLPDGPKIGSVALSPRGDWRMPSDAMMSVWMNELDRIGV
ncbi:MAG: NAD(+) synthase [Candidatus Kapabacteria bacterium]|nr:NAD(+) synthase [Candidatus Kapabacteria bacterium]